MKRKNIFISFDYDNDKDIKGNLSYQLANLNAHCSVNDLSLEQPINEKWKKHVRNIMAKCDGIIFLCGKNINDCKGVGAEMSIAQELNKPYILIKGRKKGNVPMPLNSYKEEIIYKWKEETLIDFLNKL